MKHTSSHNSSLKHLKKEKEHLQILDRSEEDPSKIQVISQIKQVDEGVIPKQIQYELQLNTQKYSQQVKEELRYLLIDLLKYPSTVQANRHRCANRLGYNDLKHIKNKLLGQSTYTSSNFHPDTCQDCGLLLQQREISLCSSVWEFPKAGIATFNLFKTMKHILGLLFILGAIFSIISLYVNFVGTRETLTVDRQNFPIFFSNWVLTQNSTINGAVQLVLSLSGFILVLVVIIWWLSIFIVMCFSQKYQRIVEQAYISASDFSIMLQNVPIHYSKEKLQEEVSRYFDSLVFNHNMKNKWGQVLKPFTIKKICRTVPFSLGESEVLDKELEGLDHDIYEKKKLFAEWIAEMKQNSKFTYSKSERDRQYHSFQKMTKRRQRKVKEMEFKAKQQYQKAKSRVTTTVIVSFNYTQSADIIEHLNPQSIPAIIRYYLSFCKSTQYFDIRDYRSNQESDIICLRAPEPEDIVWGNVSVPFCIKFTWKLLTWALILAISGSLFGIVWAISDAQVNGTGIWSSVIIGLFVTLANMFSKFLLRLVSSYQKDFTETDRQRGILLKGLFVSAFNWTIPVVITSVANESRNFYGFNGLVYEVLFISIFQSFLPPIIRFFDPQHFFRQIRAYFKSQPYSRIILKQSELNEYLQCSEYEHGWCYIYFFNLLFFCSFYITLQPAIIVPALFGCLFMILAQKYVLLHRSQRPQKIAKTLTSTVQTLLYFTPFILWVGHLVWVNAMSSVFSSTTFAGNMVLLVLSLFFFITPWRALYMCAFHFPQEQLLYYDSCRLRFPTEYDRINPATVEAGLNQYLDFINQFKEGRKQEGHQDPIDMNNSTDNMGEHYDTNYVLQEIAKIPSIFGKRNNVARKFDQDNIKPRNIKGEDIQLQLVNQKDSKMQNSKSHKVYVQKKEDSPSANKKQNETEQNIFKQKEPEFEIASQPDTEKQVRLNMSSNGNTFARRKVNEKRKSVNVMDSTEYYDPSQKKK